MALTIATYPLSQIVSSLLDKRKLHSRGSNMPMDAVQLLFNKEMDVRCGRSCVPCNIEWITDKQNI